MSVRYHDAEVLGRRVRLCLTRKALQKLSPMRRNPAQIHSAIVHEHHFVPEELVAVLWATGRGELSWAECEAQMMSKPIAETAEIVAMTIHAGLYGMKKNGV